MCVVLSLYLTHTLSPSHPLSPPLAPPISPLSSVAPITSWDRCPFKTLRGSTPGTATFTPARNYISRNFVMNGGLLYDTITHDDGAAYYTDAHNVLLYGGNQNNNAYHNYFAENLLIQPNINSNYTMPGYDAFNYDSDTVSENNYLTIKCV